MYPAVGVRRIALRAAPAGLVALGLMLAGCGDREETPLGPAATASAEPTGDAGLQAEKQRNAVNLGP
ncbi:MAG: hypothetical protein QOK27_1481, partial [Gemmatimonadales bacterium]|nr:hypothetical protein [Gemmatimonadales bacterium]